MAEDVVKIDSNDVVTLPEQKKRTHVVLDRTERDRLGNPIDIYKLVRVKKGKY